MKPVSIMWSQGVDTAEAQLAVSAVREFLQQIYAIANAAGVALRPTAIRPFGTWYIPSVERGSPYSGTSWYVDTSYDPVRRQVVAERFLDLVREEPWQKRDPHWDLALIDRDLVERVTAPPEPGDGFALGVAVPELGAVVSVFRLRGIIRSDQRQAALRRLVLHHFGRVIGLPTVTRSEAFELVEGQRYCTNRCLMSRVVTVEQLVGAAGRGGQEQIPLCDHCRHDIVQVFLLQGKSWN